MNIKELESIANEFLIEYGTTLKVPIIRNNRLKSSLGIFYYNDTKHVPIRIELGGVLFTHAHESVLIDTLKHELIHYALFTMKLPFQDDDQYFIDECKRLGVGLSAQIFVGEEYEVECLKCSRKSHTTVKKQLENNLIGNLYFTHCCNAKYKHTCTIIDNGITKNIIKIS